MTHVYTRSSSRFGWMAEVRESTPDQTPGPSLLFTSYLFTSCLFSIYPIHFLYPIYHHPHTMLFTVRGICLRTLRIPITTKIVAFNMHVKTIILFYLISVKGGISDMVPCDYETTVDTRDMSVGSLNISESSFHGLWRSHISEPYTSTILWSSVNIC